MVAMQSEDNTDKGVVRVRSWDEFKRLVESFRPEAIVYNIEQNGLSPKRELTNLRLKNCFNNFRVCNAIINPFTLFSAFYKPRVFQYFQMMGSRGLC